MMSLHPTLRSCEDVTGETVHQEEMERNGEQGKQGDRGVQGGRGAPGAQSPHGLQGPPGPAAQSRVVYTRWGRTMCPSGQGIALQRKSWRKSLPACRGCQLPCMPKNPQYSSYVPGVQGRNYVYGAEYDIEYRMYDRIDAALK